MRTRLTAVELRARLLTAYPADSPFAVWDGAEERVDLIAGLNFDDPVWCQRFQDTGLSTIYTVRMRIDEAAGEVRKKEQMAPIHWRAGRPGPPRLFSGRDGRKTGEVSATIRSSTYRRTGLVKVEKQAEFSYRTQDIREPLVRTITAAGWECRNRVLRRI